MTRILNLGCGIYPRKPCEEWPNVVNLDMLQLDGVDVIHDLNKYPWPFEDESFDSVEALNVLEHLEDFTGAMEEIHRILKLKRDNGDAGLLALTVPLAGSFNHFCDPTHKRGFTPNTFDFFDPHSDWSGIIGHYSWARFWVWKYWVCTGPDVTDIPEHRIEYKPPLPAKFWTGPSVYGTDLRFELAKMPANEQVRELQKRSRNALRTHSIGHNIYVP